MQSRQILVRCLLAWAIADACRKAPILFGKAAVFPEAAHSGGLFNMMKHFLLCLALIPITAHSQTATIEKPKASVEVAFNLGHAFDNAYTAGYSPGRKLGHGGYLRSSLSLLKRHGNFQYGLTAEGGTNSNDYWYLTPGVVANAVFPVCKGYLYSGAMVGYVYSRDMLESLKSDYGLNQGYVFGLQGGMALPLNKRLSLSAELAVRSHQVWTRTSGFSTWGGGEPAFRSDIILYVPATLGVRYRL